MILVEWLSIGIEDEREKIEIAGLLPANTTVARQPGFGLKSPTLAVPVRPFVSDDPVGRFIESEVASRLNHPATILEVRPPRLAEFVEPCVHRIRDAHRAAALRPVSGRRASVTPPVEIDPRVTLRAVEERLRDRNLTAVARPGHASLRLLASVFVCAIAVDSTS